MLGINPQLRRKANFSKSSHQLPAKSEKLHPSKLVEVQHSPGCLTARVDAPKKSAGTFCHQSGLEKESETKVQELGT